MNGTAVDYTAAKPDLFTDVQGTCASGTTLGMVSPGDPDNGHTIKFEGDTPGTPLPATAAAIGALS